jgi:hypothetical protein
VTSLNDTYDLICLRMQQNVLTKYFLSTSKYCTKNPSQLVITCPSRDDPSPLLSTIFWQHLSMLQSNPPAHTMSTFTFSRQDILYRNFRTWRRKYIRCIGNPHLTLALLLLAFFLYQMSTDDPSTSTFTKTQLNHQPLDSNFRITRSQVASKKHAQAAIILLAPQREAMSLWNVDRFVFCDEPFAALISI